MDREGTVKDIGRIEPSKGAGYSCYLGPTEQEHIMNRPKRR